MTYAHDCAGVNSPGLAFLDWQCLWLTEIEPFPAAVCKYHYPQVPNLGDTTKAHPANLGPIDLLIGGTPCQGLSVAGKRAGLRDERSGLAWNYLRLARECRPRWLLWENVPGARQGTLAEDLHAFASEIRELGYLGCFATLDAQFFGVPQSRDRIFLVAYLGDWRPPAAVLFDPACLSGNPPPRRETRDTVSALTSNGVGTCGADDNQAQAGHIIARSLTTSNQRNNLSTENFITHTLRGEGFDGSEDGTGRGIPLVSFEPRMVRTTGGQPRENSVGCLRHNSSGDSMPCVATSSSVRRLTPVECERLMGFPDNYTRIPWRGKPAEQCPDGHRYKACGNSIAVPCLSHLYRQINLVESCLS